MANYFRTLYLGALNIVIQPHAPKMYAQRFEQCAELLKADFKRRKFFSRRNDGYLITSIRAIDDDGVKNGYVGEIARFLKFDPKEASQWLKLSSGKQAEADDIMTVNVPPDLQPSLGIFRFVFYPQNHRLVFETRSGGRSLSHRSVHDLFDYFFNHPGLPPGTDRVRITVEQSRQMISRIMKLEDLAAVDLKLARPNDLITAQDKEEAIAAMTEAGVEEIEIRMQRTHEKPIVLWDWLKRLAGWTPSNGSFTATGYEKGKKVKLSTENHPITHKPRYDSRISMAADAFLVESHKLGDDLDKG
ncbi:DUF4747 family protein [Burkholderia ambifaria]|uniref:DUF4747 family protein n=1 Tax=Burkholderia ambifaria TaxID=152480 RepID=UPI003C7D1422